MSSFRKIRHNVLALKRAVLWSSFLQVYFLAGFLAAAFLVFGLASFLAGFVAAVFLGFVTFLGDFAFFVDLAAFGF